MGGRLRPEADCDVSREERAAVLLLTAYAISTGEYTVVVTDDALERAHRAVIHVNRIEDRLIVEWEEKP